MQNNCELCKNILNYDDYMNVDSWDRIDCILYDSKYNKYVFWVECDDWYYSRPVLDLKYCPECGRKLIKSEE